MRFIRIYRLSGARRTGGLVTAYDENWDRPRQHGHDQSWQESEWLTVADSATGDPGGGDHVACAADANLVAVEAGLTASANHPNYPGPAPMNRLECG
jgi:hypothetical protein